MRNRDYSHPSRQLSRGEGPAASGPPQLDASNEFAHFLIPCHVLASVSDAPKIASSGIQRPTALILGLTLLPPPA